MAGMRIVSYFSKVETGDVMQFLNKLSENVDKSLLDKTDDLPEERLQALTGLSHEQFNEVRGYSEVRSVTQGLFIFLMKMRTECSNKVIASILELDNEKQMSEMANSVLRLFEKDVLPFHFGVKKYNQGRHHQ